MKIGDLKEPYKSQAIERATQHSEVCELGRSPEDILSLPLDGAFRWSDTPEGNNHWRDVNSGAEPKIESNLSEPTLTTSSEGFAQIIPSEAVNQSDKIIFTNVSNQPIAEIHQQQTELLYDPDFSDAEPVDGKLRLSRAFEWDGTEQGYNYWHNIYYKYAPNNDLTEKTQNPELDEPISVALNTDFVLEALKELHEEGQISNIFCPNCEDCDCKNGQNEETDRENIKFDFQEAIPKASENGVRLNSDEYTITGNPFTTMAIFYDPNLAFSYSGTFSVEKASVKHLWMWAARNMDSLSKEQFSELTDLLRAFDEQ